MTAPIEPPSRTKTGVRPKAKSTEVRTASASGPVVIPWYGSSRFSRRTTTSGFFDLTNFVTSFAIFAPLCFGTRRHETLISARGGMIVLIAGARVAADEAVQLEGRLRPDPLHDVHRVLRPDPLEEMVLHEAGHGEARTLEVCELLLRRRDHVVVEAGDLHAAGRRVEALRDELRQLGDRVARRAARDARVLIGRAGLEGEGESLQAAQARRRRRLASGDPDRVGDDDRVGREELRGGRDPLQRSSGSRSPPRTPRGRGR